MDLAPQLKRLQKDTASQLFPNFAKNELLFRV